MSRRPFLFLFFFALAPGLARGKEAPVVESQKKTIPAEILSYPEASYSPQHMFLVDKAERKLYVFDRDKNLISSEDYVTDIGKNDGAKEKRNDKRTPEGIYFFQKKLIQPEIPFSLYGSTAFTTDYPNFFDRLEKKTGDGIWFHAVPDDVTLNRGSRGCVVVRDEIIKKVSSKIELGITTMIIKDKVEWLNEEEHQAQLKKVNNFINEWKKSWMSQDADDYLTFYDKKFTAPGFNYNSWQKHKKNLTQKYESIKIDFNDLLILKHKNQIVIKAKQNYESDQYKDAGIKTLYLLENKEAKSAKDQYFILREEWKSI